MHGPQIIAASISAHRYTDKHGNIWQYNPWSDYHSKVACWAVLFDVAQSCAQLREHARAGLIGFGINHQMVDFETRKHKDLDLVLCIPRTGTKAADETFRELANRYSVVLAPRFAEA